MYVFHRSLDDAHAWEHVNPEWKPVSFCQGHVTGSILVLYELPYAKTSVAATPESLPFRKTLVTRKRRAKSLNLKANAKVS